MQGETAERILTAAHRLMVERGYSAFSYADISDAVEISKASIHHHFPTKAGLASAVIRAHRERFMQATDRLDAEIPDPMARLRAYVHHWEACIARPAESFCVAALLGAELPSLPAEVQQEVKLYFATLTTWLERTLISGVRKGTISLSDSAATEAQALMAVVHGAMLSARATGICESFSIATSAALNRISLSN